jgi:hypothetical protein
MTMGYKDFSLGSDALEFLLQVLGNGMSLARLLHERCARQPGSIVTRFPAAVDLASLADFEVGGKLTAPLGSERYGHAADGTVHKMTPIPDTTADLAQFITGYLRGGGRRVCIFENYLARAGDSWLRSASSRIFFFGTEVYHVLCEGDDNPVTIANAIREAKSIPIFVGALSSPEQDLCVRGKHVLSPEDLHSVAKRVDHTIVGAYDGEGYLIWSME